MLTPLPTILLVWGGACLSHIHCAPVGHDSAIEASGSDVQLAKLNQHDETAQLDIERARIPTSVSTNPTEMDIHVLGSPSQPNGDRTTPSVRDKPDDNDMFKYWLEMYLEFLKSLWSAAAWLWQQVVPLALFLVACVATMFFGLGLLTMVLGCLAGPVLDRPTERTRLL